MKTKKNLENILSLDFDIELKDRNLDNEFIAKLEELIDQYCIGGKFEVSDFESDFDNYKIINGMIQEKYLDFMRQVLVEKSQNTKDKSVKDMCAACLMRLMILPSDYNEIKASNNKENKDTTD